MKVYLPGSTGRMRMAIAPGKEFPNTDWIDAEGKPKQIGIDFVQGSADVSEEIGRYMVDKGLARRSPLILPS